MILKMSSFQLVAHFLTTFAWEMTLVERVAPRIQQCGRFYSSPSAWVPPANRLEVITTKWSEFLEPWGSTNCPAHVWPQTFSKKIRMVNHMLGLVESCPTHQQFFCPVPAIKHFSTPSFRSTLQLANLEDMESLEDFWVIFGWRTEIVWNWDSDRRL